MKEIKIVLSGEKEEQIAQHIMKSVYEAINEHTREFRVIWHEEHNLIFLDGTWSLDGSKIIDAWQKTEVL